jgi:hypothetical protein
VPFTQRSLDFNCLQFEPKAALTFNTSSIKLLISLIKLISSLIKSRTYQCFN